jgi:hypothetical protein
MNTVLPSRDLTRIQRLPYRERYSKEEKAALIKEVTAHFSVNPKNPPRILQFHQALALAELAKYGMLYGGLLGVGSGKTDISYLAGSFFDRPLLLLPGALAKKGESDIIELKKFWRFSPPNVMSYQQLSRNGADEALYQYLPDVIIADEAHMLANRSAGRTRKLERFRQAHPCPFIPLTGTQTQDGLHDYHHLMMWSLGVNAPIPELLSEAQRWSEALGVTDFEIREPGALLTLVPAERKIFSGDEKKRARNAFAYRMINTKCVQANSEPGYNGSLNVFVERRKEPSIADALHMIEKTWTLPDGKELIDPLEINRYGRQLSLGFWYEWDPAPPKHWMEVRKAWGKIVRRILSESSYLDTPYQVQLLAIEEGLEQWNAWAAVRDSYKPETKANFISEFIVPLTKKRIAKKPNTVVWVEHRAIGELLARKLGLPFFAAEGLSAEGALIDEYRGKHAIAMVGSCGTGHNLQHNFSNNLLLSPFGSAKKMEQLIGRTHRMNQKAPEVNMEIIVHSSYHEKSLSKLRARVEYMHESGSKQKLALATVVGW